MDDIPFDTLAATVVDIAGQPIAKRMRAMFYLRTIGTPEAVKVLCQALEDKTGSCLYRHELAYVLGQMRDATAVPALTAVLEDVADDVIVRHEVREVGRQNVDKAGMTHACVRLPVTHTHTLHLLRLCTPHLQCAEALGAIAHEDSFPVLEKFAADPAPEVSETCTIAVRRWKWANSKVRATMHALAWPHTPHCTRTASHTRRMMKAKTKLRLPTTHTRV